MPPYLAKKIQFNFQIFDIFCQANEIQQNLLLSRSSEYLTSVYVVKSKFLKCFLFLFLGGAGSWTQGLARAKQVLYQWAKSPVPQSLIRMHSRDPVNKKYCHPMINVVLTETPDVCVDSEAKITERRSSSPSLETVYNLNDLKYKLGHWPHKRVILEGSWV